MSILLNYRSYGELELQDLQLQPAREMYERPFFQGLRYWAIANGVIAFFVGIIITV